MNDLNHVLLLLLMCRCLLLVTAIEPGCENCECCVDKVCARAYVQGGWRDDFCTYGCIDGIGGNKCYKKCPDDCVTCEQTIHNNCAKCEIGKYLSTINRNINGQNKQYTGCVDCPQTCETCDSETNCQECGNHYYNTEQHSDCSQQCPANCKTCTSSTNCQECYTPFYNDGFTADCSLSCVGNCVCSSPGICSTCKDGFFNINQQCMSPCPDSCTSCLDMKTCQSCKDGYYNQRDLFTSSEVTDCSLSCRGACSKSTSYDVCTSCKHGYYGSYCQKDCSVGCTNGECNAFDGSCECKDRFAGSLCDECAPGRHGELCDLQCVGACKGMLCDTITGHCVSCKAVNITGDLCEKCINGMWDTSCSSICSSHCDGQCLRNSGHCESCEGNFQGNTCNQCSAGYYGELCDEECPVQCYGSFCYRYNGTCGSCNHNYAGPTCEDCIAGFHGRLCDVPCLSTKCSNNVCNRETGNCVSCPNGFYGFQCTLSCSPGCNGNVCDYASGACIECRKPYTGDKCCLSGGNCRECSSHSVCEMCENGLYGDKCDTPCPTSCYIDDKDTQCQKDNGICITCPNGFHGDYCNMRCSERCVNNRCDKDGGHCTDGCTGDYEGPTCAQVDDTARIVGIAVGVSAASIVVVIIILLAVFCFILRRWKRKNKQDKVVETNYVNTEFQPETPDLQEDAQTPNEYEVLGARIQMDETEYDAIK